MMKKILSRTVSIALAVLLTVSCLSGCGSKSVNTAEYLGTYSTDVTSLIPFYLPDTTGKKVISNVIDGLIETDRFGAFVPSQAESWEHNDDYSGRSTCARTPSGTTARAQRSRPSPRRTL